ncbi:MAG: hypothetical protein AB2556_24235, partial [Candidatus Thiodiazotropha sp.]
VWATRGLERVLEGSADLFESATDSRNKRTTLWLAPVASQQRAGRLAGLEIKIEPARVFQAADGRRVSWNPIHVAKAPDRQRLAILQALAQKEEEYQALGTAQRGAEHRIAFREAPAPKPKHATKALDLPQANTSASATPGCPSAARPVWSSS